MMKIMIMLWRDFTANKTNKFYRRFPTSGVGIPVVTSKTGIPEKELTVITEM